MTLTQLIERCESGAEHMDDRIVEAVARAIVASRNLPEGCEISWPAFHRDARAAITAFQAEAWQPISTAPKDGTWVLGASDHIQDWFLVVAWEEDAPQEPWAWRTQDGFLYHEKALTHWQPLPPAPKASP